MLEGIDIYHGDEIDWSSISQDNIQFIFIKATQGYRYVDPEYHNNISQARAKGIPVGSYHFYKNGVNAIEQAKHFCETVGLPQVGDLPPVLDWEDDEALDEEAIHDFLDYIENIYGMVPIIYSGLSFITDRKLPLSFARYPLWLAHYAQKTEAPKPWTSWTFWQHEEAGKNNFEYDSNYFVGNAEDLQMLVKK